MKSALTLSLITLLCTCGRAQNNSIRLPRVETNVAFIKSKTGFLIDSITIRTSLDTLPYGFAFPEDTMILDIAILRPVGELMLESFVRGKSFGRQRCWVDAPSADVHLSVAAGRGVIDSVGLSPVDQWFRGEIMNIRSAPNLEVAKGILINALYNSTQSLMAASFLEIYFDLPNLTRTDVGIINEVLQMEIGGVKRHPRFRPLLARRKLMVQNLPVRLSRFSLTDADGNAATLKPPKAKYWVINVYDSSNPVTQKDHPAIQKVMETDSLFAGIPFISISAEENEDRWRAYLAENDFSWPHYHEPKTKKTSLTEKIGLFPGATYLLLNEDNKIVGVFNDVYSLSVAIAYRKKNRR